MSRSGKDSIDNSELEISKTSMMQRHLEISSTKLIRSRLCGDHPKSKQPSNPRKTINTNTCNATHKRNIIKTHTTKKNKNKLYNKIINTNKYL